MLKIQVVYTSLVVVECPLHLFINRVTDQQYYGKITKISIAKKF